jgi:signal transduction histidine kinase/CheY-like chemotaxis protein
MDPDNECYCRHSHHYGRPFFSPLGQSIASVDFIPQSSFFSIYFITIFFTIFRLRKNLSLYVSFLTAGIYLVLVLLFVGRWENTSLINELQKVGFLLLAGYMAQSATKNLRRNSAEFMATEQKLLETDERLRKLSANLPGGVFQFIWNPKGEVEVLYLSSGIQELLGVSNEEIRRKPASLLKHFSNSHHNRFFYMVSRSRLQAKDWSMELEINDNRGTWVRAIFSGRPLMAQPAGGAMIHGMLLDISAKKEAEIKMKRAWDQAEEANRVKTQFLANMSHELRTPLNAIIGFSDLLFQSSLNQEQRTNLRSIRSSGESLLTLIEDMLDFSRLEVGQLKITPRFFILNDLLLEVYHSMSHLSEEKGILFTIELPRPEPWQLRADPVRIKQILLNLVENALKFTEKGRITLSYKIQTKPAQAVVFRVEDTGIGIAPEHQEDIFHEFSQIDHTSTRKYGGTGLGLAISRSLAQLMNGDLHVKSNLGLGSVFSLVLPLDEQNMKFPPRREQMTMDLNAHTQLKVLLVEDNPMNQDVQSRMLSKLGHSVTVVSNGAECLEILKSEDFDLIFMDWQMPEMDGIEATKRIKQQEIKTPVIGLSGHAVEDDQSYALNNGFDGFLTKPVRIADFQQLIQNLPL